MPYDLPPKIWMPPKPAIIQPADSKLVKASFLPGWFPVVGSPARLTSISQQDSATATGTDVTGPAGIESGDLIVILDMAFGFSTPTSVLASGFTEIVDFTDGNGKVILSYKIADGSEASATLAGMNGFSNQDEKALYTFRGDVPITSVNVQSANSQITNGNPTSQTVTSGSGTPPLIVLGGYTSIDSSPVSPRTMSPAKDGEINSSSNHYLAYKIYNSSPANVSVDMNDEGDGNALCSCYIECS